MDAIKKKYHAIEKGALMRGIKFEITIECYKKYYNKPCYYCGINAIGLDRIDSAIHYCETNIVSCCTICNIMKGTLEIDAFVNHCVRIAVNHDHTEKEKLSERALSLGLLAKDAEKEVIIAALKNNNNNRVKTAEQLKISTTTLWRKMKMLNIGITYQYDTIS